MITIFGTTYFTIGAGFVVLVLAAPFLFWFARWLWRPNVEDKPRRVRWLAVGGTTFGLLLLLAVGLFWDVYLIGQRAKELCRETGLVVFDTAITDGVLGLSAIEAWTAYGFTFLEDQIGDQKFRSSVKDGAAVRDRIQEFVAEYEFASKQEPLPPSTQRADSRLAKRVDRITRRSDGQVLGHLVAVTVGPGWLDHSVIYSSGLTFRPWICGKNSSGEVTFGQDKISHSDLVRCVLRPLHTPRRGNDEHNGSARACVVR